MAKADDLDKILDLEDAANKAWERGLHGVLDDLEKKCEGTLKPRGHWPIPGNSDDAYEYLNDYEDSSEAALELDDARVTFDQAPASTLRRSVTDVSSRLPVVLPYAYKNCSVVVLPPDV